MGQCESREEGTSGIPQSGISADVFECSVAGSHGLPGSAGGSQAQEDMSTCLRRWDSAKDRHHPPSLLMPSGNSEGPFKRLKSISHLRSVLGDLFVTYLSEEVGCKLSQE